MRQNKDITQVSILANTSLPTSRNYREKQTPVYIILSFFKNKCSDFFHYKYNLSENKTILSPGGTINIFTASSIFVSKPLHSSQYYILVIGGWTATHVGPGSGGGHGAPTTRENGFYRRSGVHRAW